MLKHRVIPIVLLDGYSVLKTIQFSTRRNLGNPITVARIYNTRNVDELVLLDIDASKYGEKIDEFTISEVASECFMPLTVGGGLRTCEDISSVLAKGADKVVLNTVLLDKPEFVAESSQQFGAQCIVASVDVRKSGDGRYEVYSHAGRDFDTPLLDWIMELEELGAGELLLNSVENDGLMTGYDLNLIHMVAETVSIPVVAAGGLSSPSDAVSAVDNGAAAVAAASVFHFTDITPDDLKLEMKSSGLPVRI
ncbi:MAG: imidazole glycerol phosphate synthase subunit HisF [Kiritimatiellaeota bacterium]|nr:imidazole glycerol phosphate synthase subunit HisF [Kiritimatiellota bacterium]